MTGKDIKKLRDARESVRLAEIALNRTLNAVCPIGSFVELEKSHGVFVRGEVVGQSTWGDKIQIKAPSGRVYWITAYSIARANGGAG